jgi:ABC-type phosphate/phosphonate transport system substrate-binding protein
MMIANARMYAASEEIAALWRALFGALGAKAGVPLEVIDHPVPQPLAELWGRPDQGAVFMCGLPFSQARPQPEILAAPVPAPAEFGNGPRYFSEFVVRADSAFQRVEDTFGHRIAFTMADSQSGCAAALTHFMSAAGRPPLYREIVAPTISPSGALDAVMNGAADVAPIDAYALRLLARYRPELADAIRVVGRTISTPIPPLVSSHAVAPTLRAAFLEAHRDSSTASLMERLLLRRFVLPAPGDYAVLRERYEAATGHWSTRPLAAATHAAFVTNPA